MVFESRRFEREEQEWYDGSEAFTATREGLRPGRVVEVRRERLGDAELRRAGPTFVLSKRSLTRGTSTRSVEHVATVCAALDRMLSRVGAVASCTLRT